MREIVHIQAGQCGNQIGAKVSFLFWINLSFFLHEKKKFYRIEQERREKKLAHLLDNIKTKKVWKSLFVSNAKWIEKKRIIFRFAKSRISEKKKNINWKSVD